MFFVLPDDAMQCLATGKVDQEKIPGYLATPDSVVLMGFGPSIEESEKVPVCK
jgi:hypothetical protein